MNRKYILFLIMILCFGNLSGCTANKIEKSPEITVSVNGTDVPYYTIPNKRNGNASNRPSTYMYVFEQNPDMEHLVEVNTGDTVTIDFAGNKPDSATVQYEFLTVPYFDGVDNTSSAVETFSTTFDITGGKYSLAVEKFDESYYSGWDSKYYTLFTPMHSYMPESHKLRYIAGILYKITAVWGQSECEYAFVIRNRDDIGKGDVTLADMSPNLNVTLKRSADWEKIIDTPVVSEEDMMMIDGSTATIPVTAELYRQFWGYSDEKLNESYYDLFRHATTHYAYINLIDRSFQWAGGARYTNLIFVTPPSEEEQEYAKNNGVELDLTRIAKDGFVFITHKDNPVDSLTIEQIQAIYAGEITNWREIGGEDIEIKAYQREQNSGSQTAMQETVMRGRQMVKPIDTQVIGAMGMLIDAVAEYENGKASIGYTYYYYINNLYKNENIKVLKINGIMPDNENLLNDSYPFSANYYAVMRSDEPADSPAKKLRDFLVTEQGQRLIEIAGYCGIGD